MSPFEGAKKEGGGSVPGFPPGLRRVLDMKSKIKFNQSRIKAGEEISLYLLAKVTGPEGGSKREPLPLNLSVVIDRSGSMSGPKLEYVKQAAIELVEKLGLKDRLSLVSYGDDVKVELSPMIVKDKDRIKRVIQAIQIDGWTNLSGGWLQGCDHVGGELFSDGVNRVMLLTDGLANRGETNPKTLAAWAADKRAQGITTTTFGVGMDYNEDLLSKMANNGGGAFYFIDNPDQASTLFKEELKDLYNVVGQNLSVAIETESSVRSVKQLFDYPHNENRGALVYQLGDLYAEEERFQLFELKLKEMEEGEFKLGQVTISYDALQGEKIKKVEKVHEIVIKVLSAEEYKKPRKDKEIEKLVLVQSVRQARKQALVYADKRAFKKAQEVLEEMAEIIKASKTKDEELLDLYDQLLEEARDMEFGARRYDAYARKGQMSKISSSDRFSRSHLRQDDLHYRKVMAAPSIERHGSAPRRIEWRGGRLDLVGPEIRIGAAADNEITLKSGLVEKYHCRLERRNGDWYLIDLSQDGTVANSGKISGPFRLSEGDTIRLGKVLLRLL